jgi:vacuolar-type H+-ATPase subunit H
MTDHACSKCAQKIIGSAIADIATLAADCEQAKQDASTYWNTAEEYAKKNKAQAERIADLERQDMYRQRMTRIERDAVVGSAAAQQRHIVELAHERDVYRADWEAWEAVHLADEDGACDAAFDRLLQKAGKTMSAVREMR